MRIARILISTKMEFTKTCTVQKHINLNTFSEQDTALIKLAEEAAGNAHAPYSRFHVGAALRFEDGATFLGSNQENPAYPSGMCAERVAVFAAKAQFPNKLVETLAISVEPHNSNGILNQAFTPPCGGCLQVLADLETRQKNTLKILIKSPDGACFEIDGIKNLLPFKFEL
jgi:cytidine deaminase